MADYIYLQNYSRKGDMGISRRVFEMIATEATNRVNGATVSNAKNGVFKVSHPITCIFKDGKVIINIHVTIKRGIKVNDVCLKIQEEVANSLMVMCEVIPFNINIKVAAIES